MPFSLAFDWVWPIGDSAFDVREKSEDGVFILLTSSLCLKPQLLPGSPLQIALSLASSNYSLPLPLQAYGCN